MGLGRTTLSIAVLAVASWAPAGASEPPKPGQDFAVEPPGIEMRWIEPGEFLLGSPANEASRGTDEGPQTRVRITRGYWIGKTEVTQAQWRIVMGTNPSRFAGATLPVEQVSWNDAMEFGRRLTTRERAAGRLPEGYAYTLPTEAQWEYAAKAGMTGAFSISVDELAWHDQNTQQTQPVGTRRPNAWGLHDALGNVWEWCLDWYGPYPGGAVSDYGGPPGGSAKASRGGSWWAGPRGARPANRYRDMPHNGNDDLGFRLALTPVAALGGRIALAGTDSMAPMVRRWIELFRATHRGVAFHFETGAPPTAAAGLAAGTATIGYTGRALWEPEVAAIVRARGQAPRSMRVGAGAFDDARKTHTMAVFVHAANPLMALTLAQLRQVFSGAGETMTWDRFGVGGEWSGRPIRAVVAKLGTGATNSVQEVVLRGGSWRQSLAEYPTDEAAVTAVAADRFAIGIAGLPYRTPALRAVSLGEDDAGPFFEPTRDNVVKRRYPLARLLYFHVVQPGGQPLDVATKEFLRFVLSEAGQSVALESGYLPLTLAITGEELRKLEMD